MAVTIFKDASYNLQGLIIKIDHGDIGLPDIQRPFVWSNAKVRDLFDSMYKGFPVGYLLFWATGAETNTKKIGDTEKQTSPSLLIVDGQQRLTSLYAVLTGHAVIKSDHTKGRIRIAFRPSDERFEVTDATIEKNPEFIPDISEIYKGNFLSFVNGFLKKLEDHRGEEIDESESNRLAENLDRLRDLQNYPFQAIELDKSVDEERVADIFVRINSEGVQLNTSDFILTLMSVFAENERKNLEDFSRLSSRPSEHNAPSPFNYFISPSPDQLLRVAVGLAFKRGRLQSIYSILRGKDLSTGEFDQARKDEQFDKLKIAQENVLNLNHWHEFLKCLSLAGFRSSRMITSEAAVLYTYLLWLIGKLEYSVPSQQLRDVIARWWFMSHLTGRYTGSTESMVEFELNSIEKIYDKTADNFCNFLSGIIRDTLTADYWRINLPNRLGTASAKSPPLSAYWAALNILDAELLFSKVKVSTMLDPRITPVKDMERHHLFPRAFLDKIGVKEQWKRNQIANLTFIDWSENMRISESSPSDYWDIMIASMGTSQIQRQMEHHALPQGWERMNYEDFLIQRRHLMAKIVKEGFEKLSSNKDNESDFNLTERIKRGESHYLEFKQSARWSFNTEQKQKSELIIIKTIAGFMNADGGSLLIGVKDDGTITGLSDDLSTLSKGNLDGYELFLMQLIHNSLTGPSNTYCKIEFHNIGDYHVCEVKVAPATKPVFSLSLKDKNKTDFWLRQGNSTVQIFGSDLQEYISTHWID